MWTAPGEPDTLIWVGVALIYLGGFGPLVAAAVVVSAGGGDLRSWARQLVKWRVPARWWVVALGLPIFATLVVAMLYVAMGAPHDVESLAPLAFYALLLLFATVFSGGLNEEPGWRGLALPLLQERYSTLTASVLIGIVWGRWPPPLFFAPVAPHSSTPLVSALFYFPAIVVWSILLTWLYNGSASVLLPMVLHAGLNTSGGWIPVDPDAVIVEGVIQEGYVGLISALHFGVYAVLAAITIVLFGWRRLGRGDVPTGEVAGFRKTN